MNDDSARDAVLSILQAMHLDAQPIQEIPGSKTPDLLVKHEGKRILTEVKSKEDDQQIRKLLKAQKGTQLSYSPASLDTIVRNAWRQIRDFPGRRGDDLALIWFIARTHGGITVLSRPAMQGLLYGITMLEGRHDDGTMYFKECYFFSESAFFKRKEIDGIVLHDDNSIEVCLNPFSTGSGTLGEILKSKFTLVHPDQLEADGQCFIADCDHDRNDTSAVVQYLKVKYSLDTVTILKPLFINHSAD